MTTTPGLPPLSWKTLLTEHPEYILIPLHPGTKIPAIKWAPYINTPPTTAQVESWLNRWLPHSVGLLTGPHSGILCLDFDLPPYPEHGLYTQTPSGGRHYFYPWFKGAHHSIACRPGLDVPYIVKLYATPQINPLPLPIDITPTTPRTATPKLPIDRQLVGLRHFTRCNFIRWFRVRRQDSDWAGRYHLARAYASNMAFCTAPDESLGDNYRHQEKIYASLKRPITCQRIWSYGYHCEHMDQTGLCTKRAGISSPYGLALKYSRDKTT